MILLCLARGEDTAPNTSSLLKPFYKIAMFLYKRTFKYFPKLYSSPQVEKDLLQLYPGEPGECLKTEYYVKKAALCLIIAFAGTLFGAAAKFSTESEMVLREGGTIIRDSYQEGSREVTLSFDNGEKPMDFKIEVEPVLLSGRAAEIVVDAEVVEVDETPESDADGADEEAEPVEAAVDDDEAAADNENEEDKEKEDK